MKNDIGERLRWVLFIPSGVVASVLITFPLHIILYFTLSGGPEPFITPYLGDFFWNMILIFWITGYIGRTYIERISSLTYCLVYGIYGKWENRTNQILHKAKGIAILMSLFKGLWSFLFVTPCLYLTDSQCGFQYRPSCKDRVKRNKNSGLRVS